MYSIGKTAITGIGPLLFESEPWINPWFFRLIRNTHQNLFFSLVSLHLIVPIRCCFTGLLYSTRVISRPYLARSSVLRGLGSRQPKFPKMTYRRIFLYFEKSIVVSGVAFLLQVKLKPVMKSRYLCLPVFRHWFTQKYVLEPRWIPISFATVKVEPHDI
jgi:hypothetical protein